MEVLPESLAGPPARDALPRVPDDRKLTQAAELHIVLKRDSAPAEREDSKGWNMNRVPGWLRWLVPATVGVRVIVPGTEAGRLLRMLERVAVAVTWAATVIGTLFGASAAHLPPVGTTIVVALEVVAPPVIFRARRPDNDG